MEIWGFRQLIGLASLCFIVFSETGRASILSIGKIYPGFEGTPMNFVDRDGLFLQSNNSVFSFGFIATRDPSLLLLCIVHVPTTTVIWSANRDSPVSNSDKFVFDKDGSVMLQKEGKQVWKLDSGGSAIEMEDSGNLVLRGTDNVTMVWQSFDHPTDTIISNQEFKEGMKLTSDPSSDKMDYVLEIKAGDMILSANSPTLQPYWSMGKESRKTVNQDGGDVISASIIENSWRFFGHRNTLLWQFTLSRYKLDENSTWAAVLGIDGSISFTNLANAGSGGPSNTKIPNDLCARPESCDPYYVCSGDNKCQCPSGLNSAANCKTGLAVSACNKSNGGSAELVSAGDGLGYFALGFVSPSLKTSLDRCKDLCASNCSCLGLFYKNSDSDCFMFDWIGSLQTSKPGSGLSTYIKVSRDGGKANGDTKDKKDFPIVVIIVLSTVVVITGLVYIAYRLHKEKNKVPETGHETSEEDNFFESLAGMPIRFTYKDLEIATNGFSKKLGQGGFGSVYRGELKDGTLIAVKQLEGVGQGKKEFRAEVTIIGSIHHHHLVRLRGFCVEGTHRLLVLEFMPNGSLDKWIFKRNNEKLLLDWDTRYKIALGTAKGLAYLHEDCDSKIVHCDIKPENVLLDENFLAKVSDFGLAKLMTREQSHVFTTMRGTRGYLAPEWITNYAISEKSDVYSYGMVLLEIIGGRKNFDPNENSEKSHFPSYVFKMMEEDKLKEMLDAGMKIDADDERVYIAIKVALWCIQEDMASRPPMIKVVQMLEGLCPVPRPPISSTLGVRLYSKFFKSSSDEGTSSGPSDCNSDAYLSAVRLSGPR